MRRVFSVFVGALILVVFATYTAQTAFEPATLSDGVHSAVVDPHRLNFGSGQCVTGSGGTASITLCTPNRTAASPTIAASDMGGQVNATSSPATIPAISSTIFSTGATVVIVNRSGGNLTVNSTPTINGCTSPIPAAGWWALTSNGTSLDCFSAAAGAAVSFANPTGTASDVANNGSLSTAMRSDATPAIQKASSSVFGVVKVDGSTVTASNGVISATGTASGVASLGTSTPALVLAGTGSGPYTGIVTANVSAVERSQAGGNLVAGDASKFVLNTGGSGVNLPVHTTSGFGSGWFTTVLTDSNPATITVTTDTIDGSSTEPLGAYQGIGLFSDGGSVYRGIRGMPKVVASGVLVSDSNRKSLWQAGTSSQVVLGNGTLGNYSGGVNGAIKSNGSGTFTQAASTDLSDTAQIGLLNAAQTATAAKSFAEVHGTAYSPSLSANAYTLLASDCGKQLNMPAGSSGATLKVPANMAPATGACVVTVYQAGANQYTIAVDGSGSVLDTQADGFTKTKGQGAFISVILTVPSSSTAHWNFVGQGA